MFPLFLSSPPHVSQTPAILFSPLNQWVAFCFVFLPLSLSFLHAPLPIGEFNFVVPLELCELSLCCTTKEHKRLIIHLNIGASLLCAFHHEGTQRFPPVT